MKIFLKVHSSLCAYHDDHHYKCIEFFTAIASYQTISNFFLIDNIDAVPQHIKI